MEVCEVCMQDTMDVDGCSVREIYIDGMAYKRIKCGDEADYDFYIEEGDRCPECHALCGNYHHWGCGVEICPVCGEPLSDCECEKEIDM